MSLLTWSNSVYKISVYVKFSWLIDWKSCLGLGSLPSFHSSLSLFATRKFRPRHAVAPGSHRWTRGLLLEYAVPATAGRACASQRQQPCAVPLHCGLASWQKIFVHLELLYTNVFHCISVYLDFSLSTILRGFWKASVAIPILPGISAFLTSFGCLFFFGFWKLQAPETSALHLGPPCGRGCHQFSFAWFLQPWSRTTRIIIHGCGKHLWLQEGAEVELCSDFEWSGG